MKAILFILFAPFVVLAQHAVQSGMYSWKKPVGKHQENILSTALFEGSAHDLEYVQLSANAIVPSVRKTALLVPGKEEHLLIIKTGTLSVGMKDSIWSIGAGSIALLMAGEHYSLQNAGKDSCTYYTLKYRSKLPMDEARGQAAGGSVVKDWDKVAFKPHDRGGVRNYFVRPTAMLKRFDIHVTTLKEGIKSHEPHTHKAEEIVLVIDNKTEMQIGDQYYAGGNGNIYYLGSNVPHALRNNGTGTCTYFAIQFE